MWSELGSPPDADEIEVTVLGPGYGESVVVHLGNGEWLIVDSCVDAVDKQKPSAPLKYLQQLGVQVDQAVKFIVVSHWDDDHVKGIAEVVEACPNADFITSSVLAEEKFTCFVEALALGASQADGGNVKNIRRVLHFLESTGKPLKDAVPARQLCANPKIFCWSPSDIDRTEFLKSVMQMHPSAGDGLRKAISGDSNLASIVLTIEWPDVSILLGADMENSSDNRRGWGAVVSEITKIGVALGDLVKIPHHGSSTGHDDRMWDQLLRDKPVSVLTPFGKGALKSRPPTSSDIKRIIGKSRHLYRTAGHTTSTRPRMDWAVQRSIREGLITLTSKKTPMGIVRHRRVPGADWRGETFGAAVRIK